MNKLLSIIFGVGVLFLVGGSASAAVSDATVTVCNTPVGSGIGANFEFTNNIDNSIVSVKGNFINVAKCGDFTFDASNVSSVVITPVILNGWVPVPAVCNVNIASGGKYQCDFAQTYHPARLTVNIKAIGGDASFAPFFIPSGPFVHISTLNGVGSKTLGMAPGSYLTSLIVPVGWKLQYNSCPTVILLNDGVHSCDYEVVKKPSVVINHQVINNSSTNKYFGNFTIRLDGNVVSFGNIVLDVGIYNLSIDPDPDFDHFISGDCAQDGTLVLFPGDNKQCYIVSKAKSFNFSFLSGYNSITKSFKKDAVIPLKVKVTTSNGMVADKEIPSVYVINPNGSRVKAFSLNTAFKENLMRFNQVHQYFEYDLSTKLMTGPGSYKVEIKTSDGESHIANIVN